MPDPTPIRRPGQKETRSGGRIALNRGGTVAYYSQLNSHVAFVRDFNFKGVFFYSKVRPELNAEIEIAFMVPDSADYKRFVGRGMVVRVEDTRSGLIGVAARLSRCEIIPEKPASAQSIPQVWTNAAVR